MTYNKWVISFSMAGMLLSAQIVTPFNITQAEHSVIAESVTNLENTLIHQIKEDDTLSELAAAFTLEESLLKQISDRSKFKLSEVNNWIVLYQKRYLILSDEHFHEYAIYDLQLPNKDKKLPYSKISATDELLQIINILHEQLGHQENDAHNHDEKGHEHHNHAHSHNQHDHGVHQHENEHTHHNHDVHQHENEHTHHNHDVHRHENEHIHHNHDVHQHENEHTHHDHNVHQHENEHMHHDHDVHQHENENEYQHSDEHTRDFDMSNIVSEDENGYIIQHGDHTHYVPKKTQSSLTEELESEHFVAATTEEKVQYIARVYGVPLEAIRVSTENFVFNDPSHEYDPTHIHPVIIPIQALALPKVTGDAETDFENELLSVSRRIGLPPYMITVENNQFVIPHKDHNHYLKIEQLEGSKLFYQHQLPEIAGTYIKGDFDLPTVETRVSQLLSDAKTRYKDDSKALSRINYRLQQFLTDMKQLPANSTEGYLEMLDQFNRTHILEEASSTNHTVNVEFNEKYQTVIKKIRQVNLESYTITHDQLLEQLYATSSTQDTKAVEALDRFIEEIKFSRNNPGIASMKYLDYLLANIDHPSISNDVREEIARLAPLTFATQFGKPTVPLPELFVPLIKAKDTVEHALQSGNVIENRPESEIVNAFKTDKVHEEMTHFLSDIRDVLVKYEVSFIPDAIIIEPDAESLTESTESVESANFSNNPNEVEDETTDNAHISNESDLSSTSIEESTDSPIDDTTVNTSNP